MSSVDRPRVATRYTPVKFTGFMAKQLTLGLTRTSMALFHLAVLIAALAQSLIFDSLAKTVNFGLKVKYLMEG